jgi:hypothetical protein
LTNGAHAATHDTMVMSWSHVYLGRVYEDDGDVERARSEYQAALAVEGASEQVQFAAQRGLAGLQNRKPGERP